MKIGKRFVIPRSRQEAEQRISQLEHEKKKLEQDLLLRASDLEWQGRARVVLKWFDKEIEYQNDWIAKSKEQGRGGAREGRSV